MNAQELVDEATFEFTMGDHDAAIAHLDQAVKVDPACFAAWHAMAEIEFDRDNYDRALEAGTIAVGLKEADIHIHTTLSMDANSLGTRALRDFRQSMLGRHSSRAALSHSGRLTE